MLTWTHSLKIIFKISVHITIAAMILMPLYAY